MDWDKFRQSKTYDFIMGLPLIAWFIYVMIQMRPVLGHFAREMLQHPGDVFSLLRFYAYLAAAAFAFLNIVMIVIRTSPIRRPKGLSPRAFAVAGTFLGVGINYLPPASLNLPAQSVALALILAGSIGSVFALAKLGKSFSIMPEARTLRTTGPYALALRSLLRDLCGASNLTRVAVMQVGRPGTTWTFSAFDVAAGRLTPVTVPNLAPETSQGFTVSDTAQDTAFFQHGPDSKLPLLLRDADLRAASVTDVESAVREALRIENPARENPGTVDCVSCHLTDRARHLAESVRGVTLPATPERYVDARFDLSLKPDGAGIRAQRAFGYFADQPSIIQRVVNESAEAARQLELLP